MYVKTSTDGQLQYPYGVTDYLLENPNTSMPEDVETFFYDQGIFKVWATLPPKALYNQVVVAIDPERVQARSPDGTFKSDDPSTPENEAWVWEQRWALQDATPEQMQANLRNLEKAVVTLVQSRLDSFANSRGYDSIVSACTYATDPIERFRFEGQRCVELRGATWAKLYEMLDEITAGTRPIPDGPNDLLPELPTLVWSGF
jgi:hypothetical protein